jgi:hypothetical protein
MTIETTRVAAGGEAPPRDVAKQRAKAWQNNIIKSLINRSHEDVYALPPPRAERAAWLAAQRPRRIYTQTSTPSTNPYDSN